MTKTVIALSICCLVLGVSIIFILFFTSNSLNHQKNSFIRLTPPHLIRNPQQTDIKYNSYYIAGATENSIYLGNFNAPLHLLVTNYALTDTQHVTIKVRAADSLAWKAAMVEVDSPNIYILDRITHSVLFGKFPNLRNERRKLKLTTNLVNNILPISRNSYALVTHDINLKQKILAKERIDTPYVVKSNKALEKQIDGSFCVDGMFNYSQELNRLVYVYYYRNQFITMDTNLNILYRGKTIDTISRAQIKVASVKSEHMKTMAAPALFVNKRSCISTGRLFINSGLRAKNESEEVFEDYSVIDVYSMTDGVYQYSFYVPKHEGHKLQSFKIHNNTLIAIYDHYLLLYSLTLI